ncbi:MAG: hypothetical protein MZV64_26850 [Ignavibacteriales bacterium]|nr:hypothetical protein [Ignavibacteriales bacterium]
MNKFPDIKHHLKRIIAINAVSLMLIAPAHAAYNGAVLSEIKINPYYDKSFQIVLKTGQNIPVDKHIVSDEEIVLELRDVKAAKFVNTIYNNTSGIDHVIVQPLSGNRVRLLMQGSNIAASRVVIDSNKSASNSTQSRPSANIAAQNKT